MLQALTNDDLIWIIGQKEATLLLLTRQAQGLLAENESLKKEISAFRSAQEKAPNGTDYRQTLDTPVPTEAAS